LPYLIIYLAALAIAALAGFYASSDPDGLEKVTSTLRLIKKAVVSPRIFSGRLSELFAPPYSNILAAVFGVILIIFIFRSLSKARHIAEFVRSLIDPSRR